MMPRSALLASAEAAAGCLGVGAADHVLVVYNDEQAVIAEALAAAAKPRARAVTLLEFPTLLRDWEEPPGDVAEAIAGPRGVRIATLPTITEDLRSRCCC